MSRALEELVLAPGHVLAPAHRMVLLTIARKVRDGQTEVAVDRTRLARYLHTRPGVVLDALKAGEAVGACTGRSVP